MTRLWGQSLRWGAIAVGIVAILAAVVVGIATQSAFGRERVRRIAERMVGASMMGSLQLGALRFGPGCTLAIDSARLRDAGDSLLISVGPTRAQCRFTALMRGKLVLTAIDVRQPYVVMRELPSGEWNWTRAFGADTTTAETESTLRVEGSLRVHDGTFVIETFAGAVAPRDETTSTALPVADGRDSVVRRRITRLDLDVPNLRTNEGDALAVAEVSRFAADIDEPSVILRDVRGHVRVTGDSLRFDISRLALPGSMGRATGVISLKEGEPARFQVDVAADTVSLADLRGLLPFLPDSGGGKARFTMASSADGSIVDYTLSDAELRSGRSYLRGGATFAIGDSLVGLRNVAVTADPVETALLARMSDVQLPPWAAGTLRGFLVSQGGPLDRLMIDSVSVRFAGAGMRRESRAIAARGTIRIGSELGFIGLRVRTDALDLRPFARLVPGFPPLMGRLTAAVRLDSSLTDLRISDATIAYDEGGQVLRVKGGGWVSMDRRWVDLTVEGLPLAIAALGGSYPALARVPSVEGRIRVTGTPRALVVTTDLRGAAGAVVFDGEFDVEAPELAGRATAQVREVDLACVLGPAAAVAGVLGANVALDVHGDSLSTLEGRVELTDIAGRVNAIDVEPSLVRLRLADGWLRADSVLVVSSAGSLRGHGALGLRRGLRDTLTVEAEGVALRPLLAGIADRTRSDSIDGTLGVRARLVGSIDSLDVEAVAEVVGLVMPAARATRAQATVAITGLPRAVRGSANVRIDSIDAGELSLAMVATSAKTSDGTTWHVGIVTGNDDRPGGRIDGAVIMGADSTIVAVDSFTVNLVGRTLRSTAPARLRVDASGFRLDTLQLRGSGGSYIRVVGTYADSGAIDAAASVTGIPYPLSRQLAASDSVRGRIDADVRLRGTAAMPTIDLNATIAAEAPGSLIVDSGVVTASYESGVARVDIGARRGAASRLTARASVPVVLSLAPMTVRALDEPLSGELVADSVALPELTSTPGDVSMTSGVVAGRVTLGGTPRRVMPTGELTLRGGAATIHSMGVGFRDANATVSFLGDSIVVRDAGVRAATGPGDAALSGVVRLGDSGTVDVQLRSREMPVMNDPRSMSFDITSDLRVSGRMSAPALAGTITIPRAAVRVRNVGKSGAGDNDPEFVRLVDSLTAQPKRKRTSGLGQNVRIDSVDVTMGPNVWVRSAEVNAKLGGTIRVSQVPSADGPPRLSLRGTLLPERGTYRFSLGVLERTFQLQEGSSVEFTGGDDLDAKLDINALYTRGAADGQTLGRELRLLAHVGGTLNEPKLEFSSDGPPMTEAELMNYLLTGQASVAVGEAFDDGAVGSEFVTRAADMLAQRLAGGYFDVVSVKAGGVNSTTDGGSSANSLATSRLGLGKQVADRVFLNVDAGLCGLAQTDATSLNFSESLGMSLDYRFRSAWSFSLSSEPSTNAARCTDASSQRGTALTPRQWGLGFSRKWRF
jgi:TamB, inner membrane protein subunit of TAM complex